MTLPAQCLVLINTCGVKRGKTVSVGGTRARNPKVGS